MPVFAYLTFILCSFSTDANSSSQTYEVKYNGPGQSEEKQEMLERACTRQFLH